MSRFDECLEELEFLNNELTIHWEEHKILRELRYEATRNLDASTRKVSEFTEAIRLLKKEKRNFESGGYKVKFALLEDRPTNQ